MHAGWGAPEYIRGQRPGDAYVRWRRRSRAAVPSAPDTPWRRWLRLGLGKTDTAQKSVEPVRRPELAA
jgi:hypothetical protein